PSVDSIFPFSHLPLHLGPIQMFPQKESRKHKKAAKFSRRFTLQSSDFCDSAVTGRNSATTGNDSAAFTIY
ncbi:MAG: hypothetical protein Q8929_15740, partial [Bacillota bacterium]|nr:hypothetical protein [Bacillota bacterium]